jgi:hypothetical protein
MDGAGPRGTQSARGVVVITRLANARAVVTLVPDIGTASAVAVAVAADGTLHALPPPGESGTEGYGRGLPAAIPPGLRALSALLETPPGGATWAVAVEAGDAGAPSTVGLSAHATAHDADRTLTADGSGTVEVAQPPANRERGGFGAGGVGGGGFPGGGGGRRRGAGDAEPQRVQATLALHVEASFRNGTLLGARGSETTTPQQGDTTPRTATWSLWPY